MTIDWGDAPAWTAIGLSGCFSVAAFVISLKGLKWQREGTEAAKTAAEAAIRSANADERSNALAELSVSIQAGTTSRAQQEHQQERQVSWDLDRSRDRFVLRNVGSAIATGVKVGGDRVAEVGTEVPDNAAVRPGASVSFMMVGSLAYSVPDEIEVTWDGHPEPVILPVPPG
jgi:hypothetical protein